MSNVAIGKRRRDQSASETALDARQFVDLEALVDENEEEEEEDEELGKSGVVLECNFEAEVRLLSYR